MLYERNTARLHLSNIHLTNHLYSMDFLTERNEFELEQVIKGFIMIYAVTQIKSAAMSTPWGLTHLKRLR